MRYDWILEEDEPIDQRDYVQLINKTGAPSVRGMLVSISDTVDRAVRLVEQDKPDCIGVFRDDGVPDGSPAIIVRGGLAEVLYAVPVQRKWLARTFVAADAGFVAGKATGEAVPSSPFASDKHFSEIGHVAETIAAPGYALTILHFN